MNGLVRLDPGFFVCRVMPSELASKCLDILLLGTAVVQYLVGLKRPCDKIQSILSRLYTVPNLAFT